MNMLTAVFVDDGKSFLFKNVEKISIDKEGTTIGYLDDNGVYHEESSYTPKIATIFKED